MKSISFNKKAFFDYKILDEVEAGLVLTGPEIKAVRAKEVNITGSYVKPFADATGNTELWWVGSNFKVDGDQSRSKKLLLNKIEIERLAGKLTGKSLTILPLELYISRGRAKLKIGLGSRKNQADKREELRKKAINREIERSVTDKNR